MHSSISCSNFESGTNIPSWNVTSGSGTLQYVSIPISPPSPVVTEIQLPERRPMRLVQCLHELPRAAIGFPGQLPVPAPGVQRADRAVFSTRSRLPRGNGVSDQVCPLPLLRAVARY